MYGLAIGDALGAPTEFLPLSAIRKSEAEIPDDPKKP